MEREKLSKLIRLKERPETTLSLVRAIEDAENTVDTYIFTDTIRSHFETILEKVATGRGGGFWIQAEFGAGKTHFLATLTTLLTRDDANVWAKVHDDAINNYRERFRGNKLFCVVFSLKGEGSIDIEEDNLLTVIENQIENCLEDKGLRNKILISTADELIDWYKKHPELKNIVDKFIEDKTGKTPNDFNKKDLARLIHEACRENSIRPEITTTPKERFKHIYEQLYDNGYKGILFVIDEFATWQNRHLKGTREYAIDEDVLETLGWILPKDLEMNIYVIIASQQPCLTKLKKDRYHDILLLLGVHGEAEYDIIVANRVKETIETMRPEVEAYWEHYYKHFDFLRGISKEYFHAIFPFQPRCFEAVRKITGRELPTARSGIHYIYDVIENREILERNELISVSALLVDGKNLEKDACAPNSPFKDSWESYVAAMDGLKEIVLEDDEREVAERITKALFLWNLAYLDTPKYLSPRELAEMTLTRSEIISAPDFIGIVLTKIDDLPQISYTKAKGAIFEVKKESVTRPSQIFTNMKRTIKEGTLIQDGWERSLVLQPGETNGGMFPNFELDKRISSVVEYRKVEYPGGIILAKNWRSEYAEKIKGDMHFRIVILTKKVEITDEINDPLVAVCIPDELTEAARDAIRDYLTIIEMEEKYRDQTGSDAEDVKTWLARNKCDKINGILTRQRSIYKSGKIITQKQLGMDGSVFAERNIDKNVGNMVNGLLASAYTSVPYDTKIFKKTLKKDDSKKVFEGFFKSDPPPRSLSACDNYGPGLMLSRTNEPRKFAPDNCKVFDILKEILDQNNDEIQTYKIYQKLTTYPYGLTTEFVTLYLLSFVRYGNPNVEIRLKAGQDILQTNKIKQSNVPEINWRGNIEDKFDVLAYSTEISWNNVLPFAKIINPELKTTTNHSEILAQEKNLLDSLSSLRNKIPQIKENLDILASNFGETVKTELEIVDLMDKIANTLNYTQFYETVCKTSENPEGLYENTTRLNTDIATVNNLKILSEQSTTLLTIKSYIADISLPSDDKELNGMRTKITTKLKLQSLIKTLEILDEIKSEFADLKNQFAAKYQIHHRKYNEEMANLKSILENTRSRIAALSKLSKLQIFDKTFSDEYTNLVQKIKPCVNKDPVSVDTAPVCKACKINLLTKPPAEEITKFLMQVDDALNKGRTRLFQLLTPEVKSADRAGKLKPLLESLTARDLNEFSDALSDEIVKYLQTLLEKANLVQVYSDVLSKVSEKYHYVDEKNMDEVVTTFKEELKNAIDKATKEHKGKKVRIVLK